MGEALLSSDGGGRLANMPELMMRSEDKTNDGGGDSPTTATTNNVVRWEKFLPKMTLRVMLVEADDCTRQIITALLRKCSYKGTFVITYHHLPPVIKIKKGQRRNLWSIVAKSLKKNFTKHISPKFRKCNLQAEI